MTRLASILAAVDYSRASQGAFHYALALSQKHGARLVAVHAVPPGQAYGERGAERLALTTRLEALAREAGVDLHVEVQHGDPARTILLHARTQAVDAIVMGTHQRRGLERLRLGSVAEQVASDAPAPVLLVPLTRGTSSARMVRHVAAAVDFGPGTEEVIDRAFAIASGPDDRVSLIHVVPGFSEGTPPHLYRYGGAEYQGGLVRDARTRLEAAIPADRPASAAVDAAVLVGDTTSEISRFVTSFGVDLLLVGATTRGPLSRALFGTTATRLLRALRIPVLAVPARAVSAADRRREAVQQVA